MRKEDFFEVLGELDDDIVKEAETPARKKTNWKIWGTMAACVSLIICASAIAQILEKPDVSASGDLSPMVYVQDTLYQIADSQYLTEKKQKFIYVGTIESKVSSSQYPQENFQANDDIVGSAVYQCGAEILVEINGQYWLYKAAPDVGQTTGN